jgi:mono/diheme cytochrome c family protein
MKRVFKSTFILSTILFWSALCTPQLVFALQNSEGEKLFNQSCMACHTINKGAGLGPDLVGISDRRSKKWLAGFIKSSQSVIKSGDPYAKELFEKFNKIAMPDNEFTDAQIDNIIRYIDENSSDTESVQSEDEDASEQEASEENIRSGGMLFNGRNRFANGGPPCHSCHNIDREDIVAGGTLAKDLTNVLSRVGSSGISAMISNAPFPVMAKAYEGKSITEQEVFDLTAYLQSIDGSSAASGQNYGARFFLSGLGGAAVLFGLFAGVRTRSKKTSVHHDIYERQVKSTWEDDDTNNK